MPDILVLIVTACGAAAVSGIFTLLSQHLHRRAEKSSKKDEKLDAVIKALQLTMYDRIKHLGLKIIAEGEVDYADLRLLNQMHDVYHNELSGNGDSDDIMARVRKLPLKSQEGS